MQLYNLSEEAKYVYNGKVSKLYDVYDCSTFNIPFIHHTSEITYKFILTTIIESHYHSSCSMRINLTEKAILKNDISPALLILNRNINSNILINVT